MSSPVLAGSMALPLHLVDTPAIRAAQTHAYLPMGSEEALLVRSYREEAGMLHVPRQYGIQLCQRLGLSYEDRTSQGTKVVFPRVPAPREEQVPVIEEILDKSQDYYDFIFRARTGFGKTISSLIVAARWGTTTLILVDQENLKDQWLSALSQHFGLSGKDVGVIQGSKCEVEGRTVVIGMIQTLSQKKMPAYVYSYFGAVVVDEVHTAGAPTFSTVLMQFSATHRLGVSATPKRRDGLQKLLDYNLGKVRVYVGDQHSRSSVYIARNPTVYSWYANSSPKIGRYLTEIAEDGARNLLVAESAAILYESGRDTLVLGDRIEQLTHLRSLCLYLGVPEEDMGVYTGEEYDYRYVKQTVPPRRPEGVSIRTEYTPVELKLISRKTPKAKLKAIKEEARLIFATYAMFAKGVDVARLAGGVDATPRSQAEQMHGRILRQLEGTLPAIWITIQDVNSYRSLHQLAGRLPDYLRNNAAIYTINDDWTTEPCQPDELLRSLRQQVPELKSARIETPHDGLHMLKFPALQTSHVKRDGRGIRLSRLPRPDSKTVSSPAVSSARSPTRRPSIR